jgi:type IV secretory pathway VirB10-like protein
MTRVPLAAFAAVTLLSVATPTHAQAPEQDPKKTPSSTTPCREFPAGNGLRFVCAPLPFPVHEEFSEPAGPPPVRIALMLPEGTPMRIAIDRKTRISHVGEIVQGHVVETVYSFDEPVIPAGSVVTGRITQIGTIPTLLRIRAYASGNFSPARQYQVSFDRLTLPDGRELAMTTSVAPGAAEVVHLLTKENNKDEAQQEHKSVAARAADAAKQQVKDRVHEASDAAQQAAEQIRNPGRMQRLRGYLIRQSPYHQQYLAEGTRFSASLNDLLDFGSTARNPEQLASLGTAPAPDTVVHARLVLEVSSATATRGNPVIAQLTEPVYSKDHQLLLPTDSRLIGRVLEAKPARHLHRNGELRIIFEHIELPGGALQPVQGTLEGIEVDRAAHLKLDEEGGAHATDSKTRYLSTGVALVLAAAAAHPDAERGGVDQSGDPAVRAGAGASGFGLAGTLIGLASKSNAVSIIFSAYGASASIYTNFLSRGRNVVLPKDAPLEIGLGTTHPSSSKH